jgi:hypothetical protein
MGLFVLDVIFSVFGIRGHIPRFDDFRPVPSAASARSASLMRVLAAVLAGFTMLSLTVWTTVWLAMQLL